MYLYFCSQLIWVSDVEAVMCKQGRSQQFRTCRSGTGFKIKTYFQERQRFLRPKIIKNSYLIQYVVITSLQKDQATNSEYLLFAQKPVWVLKSKVFGQKSTVVKFFLQNKMNKHFTFSGIESSKSEIQVDRFHSVLLTKIRFQSF